MTLIQRLGHAWTHWQHQPACMATTTPQQQVAQPLQQMLLVIRQQLLVMLLMLNLPRSMQMKMTAMKTAVMKMVTMMMVTSFRLLQRLHMVLRVLAARRVQMPRCPLTSQLAAQRPLQVLLVPALAVAAATAAPAVSPLFRRLRMHQTQRQ
jgi:hypothetical protein